MNKYCIPNWMRFEEQVYKIAFKYINKWWDVETLDYRRDEYLAMIFTRLQDELFGLIEQYDVEDDLYSCFIFGKDYKLIDIDITFIEGNGRFKNEK